MSTKVKYYQENDLSAMEKDRARYTKFGYIPSEKVRLDGRDAVSVTYTRDDSNPKNAELAELEERYDDAENAIRFRDSYASYDVEQNVSKRVPFAQVITSLLGLLFCGLFLVLIGGIGFAMLFMPESVEGMLSAENGSLSISVGDLEVLDRNFSYDIPEGDQMFGITQITWEGIGWVFFGLGVGIFGTLVVLIIVSMIRNKLARVDYFKSEVQHYETRMDICERAARKARVAIAEIDEKLG